MKLFCEHWRENFKLPRHILITYSKLSLLTGDGGERPGLTNGRSVCLYCSVGDAEALIFNISFHPSETTEIPSYVSKCPSNGLCSKLPPDCMTCKTNFSCVYGKPATFDCKIKPQIHCVDQRNNEVENFTINMTCQFCWQLEPTDYVCTSSTSCMTVSCPRQRYNANCTVHDHIHCLGNRVFPKMLYCNWTGGYKWSTALALSITLGGFGADRFYLGQWREGLGKLFSFGGLGIWTLIDVLLIGVGYVGPADGSLYI
uniref:TM2 domain-containing protein 3 n=1 Tax=Chelonoidis abingdonii TaxID=106734 RepID=A0A8C0GM81_CHEAB